MLTSCFLITWDAVVSSESVNVYNSSTEKPLFLKYWRVVFQTECVSTQP